MNSGTFHPSAQEWRYFSREKSLIHTLHLSQLVTSHAGDTVLIAPTSLSSNPPGTFGVPPFNIPGPAYPVPTHVPTGPSCYLYYRQSNSAVETINCSLSTNFQGGSDITFTATMFLSGIFQVDVSSTAFFPSAKFNVQVPTVDLDTLPTGTTVGFVGDSANNGICDDQNFPVTNTPYTAKCSTMLYLPHANGHIIIANGCLSCPAPSELVIGIVRVADYST